MRNYNIYYRDSVITVSAEQTKTTEFGQYVLMGYTGNTIAIIPKEALVIETEDKSEFQLKIQNIINDLSNTGFNDLERALPNFNDYKEFLENRKKLLISYFIEMLNK